MVPFFTKKKILNMGPISDWAQIFGFLHGENLENHKFVKNGSIFQEKFSTKGTLFAKMTLKDGKGFEAQAAHPCPNQIWVPLE